MNLTTKRPVCCDFYLFLRIENQIWNLPLMRWNRIQSSVSPVLDSEPRHYFRREWKYKAKCNLILNNWKTNLVGSVDHFESLKAKLGRRCYPVQCPVWVKVFFFSFRLGFPVHFSREDNKVANTGGTSYW